MGGRSSNKTDKSTNITNRNYQVSHNEIVDHGAVEGAFSFGQAALDTVEKNTSENIQANLTALNKSYDFASGANANAFNFAAAALGQNQQTNQLLADNLNSEAAEDRNFFALMRLGFVVVGLVLSLFVIFGRKKK